MDAFRCATSTRTDWLDFAVLLPTFRNNLLKHSAVGTVPVNSPKWLGQVSRNCLCRFKS
jgi:hypothetical protein